ncbi:hypothetical protein GCM10010924_13560 [Rhizobium wenxiniae]|nr:hypothetical protein GCM10010924_13560 [Rhizobium wenxiniae]
MKKASYEGRIGSKAYFFSEKGDLEPILVKGEPLRVPANSIVFVESDLEFRLPDYIALRFNLSIRHVHRGLLLGTGPLVDPGFWGRLCIPLHNLTNEEYLIAPNEGLFWVEFTKTTPGEIVGRNPLVSDPQEQSDSLDRGLWDIEKFIRKAARPLDPAKPSIPIRSSISVVAEQNRKRAETAADEATRAQKQAEESKKEAEAAKKSSVESKAALEEIKAKVESYGLIGVLLSLATAFTLWGTFFFGVRADMAALGARLDGEIAARQSKPNDAKPDSAKSTEAERLKFDVDNLKRRLDDVVRENDALRTQIQTLTSGQK